MKNMTSFPHAASMSKSILSVTSAYPWLKTLALFLILFLAAGNLWATEATLNSVSTKEVVTSSGGTVSKEFDGVTCLIKRNSGNQPGFYTSSGIVRYYSKDVMTLSVASGSTISQIDFSYYTGTSTAGTASPTGLSGTQWTGSAQSVSFTGTGTTKISSITVTYSSGGGGGTKYTVSYNSNGGSGTMTDSNSPYTSGATVTVLDNSFTAPSDKEFDHWNTASNGSGTDYDEGDTFTISANTTLYAQWKTSGGGGDTYEETALADIGSTDVVIIVGNNGGNYALSNDNGTSSAPTAVSAINISGTTLTTSATNIQWNIDQTDGDITAIYVNGSTSSWLYCTDTNNGVRVGTNDNKAFTISDGYLYNTATSRYVGIYNSSEWRCYTAHTGNNNNIKNQTFKFYVKQESCNSPLSALSVSASPTSITTAETSTLSTSGGNGNTVSYSITSANVANATISGTTFSASAAGTYTVKASQTKNGDVCPQSATTTITVTAASGGDTYEETDLEDILSTDVVIIVGNNGNNYALSNDNGTSSAPTAVSAINISGTTLTTSATNIQWNIDQTDGDITAIYVNGSTSSWLYCTDTNNGVRVGTNSNKAFTIVDGYLKHTTTSRYVGIYNSQDWRCYSSTNTNINDQTFKFYAKHLDCDPPSQVLSVSASPTAITTAETSTLSISGGNGNSVTYSVTSANAANATISGTTFSATAPGTYTVKALQTKNGDVCPQSATTTITVTATKLTVTFNAGTGSCATTSLTETTAGEGIKLPAATAPAGCDPEFDFAGWATTSVSETTTKPTLFAANSTYTGDATTLYAVYKQGAGTIGFTLSIECDETVYYATGRTGSNKYMGASTTASEAATYDIVEKDDKKYLVWIDGETITYISATASSKADLSFTTSIDDAYDWAVNDDGETITIQSNTNSRYFTFNSTANQRDRFAGYAESSKYEYVLTKGGSGGATTYNSNPACICTSVNITYNANGGTLADGCSDIVNGECDRDWKLCAAPSREGYIFAGWKDQKGILYLADAEIHSLRGSLSLTAQWLEPPYTVYFDAGNGSCNKTSLTETSHGDGVKLPSATPVGQCSGEWHFVGWTNTKLTGDDNTSYVLAGVANATYVPTVDNETLYAVYSKVDIIEDGNVEFTPYTESTIAEGLYVLVMYQVANSYGRLKYGTLNGGRIPYTNEYTTSPSSITISSPSLSDYVFQLSNVEGKWMLYNLGNETYLGAGASGQLTWAARTTALKFEVSRESESSSWWQFKYTDDDTYYLGVNKQSDYIRNYKPSTLTDTYGIKLYKGAIGTTYYSCAPQCDPCTDPEWSFRDGEYVIRTLGSPNYTNLVDEVYHSTGAVLYKSSNEAVATVNASTGEVTPITTGSTIITLKLAKTATYCAQVLQYELEIKDPTVEILEVTKSTDPNNQSDPNEYYGIVVEHDLEGNSEIVIKERETTIVGEYANDLFISKYFEAASNMKLFAIFNGTDHPIPFTNIRVRSNCLPDTAGGSTIWSDRQGRPGYVELKTIERLREDFPDLMIPSGRELIFWSNNYGNTNNAQYNTTLRNCISMTIDGKSYNYTNMANDEIPYWYCLGDKQTYYKTDADGNNQFIFNGDDSIILERDSSNTSTPDWKLIDIVGAGTKEAPANKTGLVDKITTAYSINGSNQALNDDEGFHCIPEGKTIPYSTNRYMLIRKKEVKDGKNAVASNKTSFATLCTEWEGTPVGGSSSAYCYSGKCFSTIAQYDYAKEYVHWEDLPPTVLSSFDNGDGTQTILIKDMADRACNTLQISVRNDNDDILAEAEFKIPIIVDATDVKTSSSIFTEQHDACATCDVIVMAGATLSKAADDELDDKAFIRNLDVYAGGKVIIPSETNYNVNNLTFRSRVASDGLNMSVPSMIINGHLNHNMHGVSQRIRIDDRRFYNFVLPYAVRISQITFSNGEPAVYGEDYIIDTYDGEKRAQTQAGGCWEHYDGSILYPGVGYTIAVAPKAGHTYSDLQFPMLDADLSEGEPDTKSMNVYAWGTTETRANHKGWNLIGNPYLQIYGKNNLYTASGEMLTTGQLIPDEEHPGWWKNDASSLPYVTMINSTRDDYVQKEVRLEELPPFTTFFVQVGQSETASGTKVDLTFNKEHRKVPSAPMRYLAESATPTITRVGFFLTGANAQDNFGIVVGEQYSEAYDMQADLSKEFGTAYSLKAYALQDNDNMRLAYEAVHPDRLVQPLPIGVRLPKVGEYTFSIDERYDLGAFQHIYLNDNIEGRFVDLLEENYSFEGKKSQIDNRFSLSLVLLPKTPTDADRVVSGIAITSRKGSLMLSGLPQNADIYVYDIAGHLIISEQLANQSTIVYPMATGVYQVRVVTGGNNALLRTIVY